MMDVPAKKGCKGYSLIFLDGERCEVGVGAVSSTHYFGDGPPSQAVADIWCGFHSQQFLSCRFPPY